jgi:G:T-mismatch repair DNA endonuclease (very short patch repair protein)
MLYCKYPTCPNVIGLSDVYCAVHATGSVHLTRVQRKHVREYKFAKMFSPDILPPEDIPTILLGVPANSAVAFLPVNRTERTLGVCYWSEGRKVLWKGKYAYTCCLFDDCTTVPNFGMPTDPRASRCSKHQLDGMIDIKSARCASDGCTTQPSFGNPDNARPTRCGKHQLDGMIDIVHARCEFVGCTTHPSFGDPDDARATRCGKHQLDGMIDIVHARCVSPDCTTQPVFGNPNEARPTRCGKHQLDGMIDIKNPKCVFNGCTTQPVFGMANDPRATRCGKHQLDGMIDIVSARCVSPDCTTRPIFGNPDDARASHCRAHKLPKMIDIVNARCNFTFIDGAHCASQVVSTGETCTVHHPEYRKAASGHSKICCQYLDLFAAKHNVTIQHKHYDRLTGVLCGAEHRIAGVSSKSGVTAVDGYIAPTKTVLEFHGDFWHGNPNVHRADDWNAVTKCTFGDLYDNTAARMQNLKDLGYIVYYIWERDFRDFLKEQTAFSSLPYRQW